MTGLIFLSNGYFLILIKSHLHPLRGLLKADLEEFSLFFLLLGRSRNAVLFSCRTSGLGAYSCISAVELGPTEFLQGWKSVEVGFDGRLIGGRQVWQALEGAWERQVVGLRLWGQDAAYPIVFWRHIHTYTDTEKGRKKKWAGWLFISPHPIQKKLARIRWPPAERGRLSCRQAGVLVLQIFPEALLLFCKLIQVKIWQKTSFTSFRENSLLLPGL